jgi:hypothetical protein
VSLALLTGAWVACPTAALAEPDLSNVQVHGFVSQGFIKTTNNDYLASSKRGSFEFSEVGLNFTANLTDNLRAGFQLFAQDLGPIGDYRARFDWYYLDYRFQDWLGIRAGRTKIPFGLYNESSDVDAARVPILLPQSVYPIDHRDYLLAQTGGELYGSVRLGSLGSLEYRGYAGTLYADPPSTVPDGITQKNFAVPYVVGGRLLWSPIENLQLGGSFQSLRFDWDYQISEALVAPLQTAGILPMEFDGTLSTKFRVNLWVASLEYQLSGLLLSAEYSRWVGEFESRAPKLLPPHTVNERYYLMASYRVASWFTPGVYYSSYVPNVDDRDGRETHQYDAAISLRYDLTANWILKLEGHYMEGTAALDNKALNHGAEPKDLVSTWGLFLVKTTAYF